VSNTNNQGKNKPYNPWHMQIGIANDRECYRIACYLIPENPSETHPQLRRMTVNLLSQILYAADSSEKLIELAHSKASELDGFIEVSDAKRKTVQAKLIAAVSEFAIDPKGWVQNIYAYALSMSQKPAQQSVQKCCSKDNAIESYSGETMTSKHKNIHLHLGLFPSGIIPGFIARVVAFSFVAMAFVATYQLADRFLLLQEAQAGYPAAKAKLEQMLMSEKDLIKEIRSQ
jgi:hypothetical protein